VDSDRSSTYSGIALLQGLWLLSYADWLDGIFMTAVGLVMVTRLARGFSESVQAWIFPAGCILIGGVLFLLAAIGVTWAPLLWGSLGALVAACGVYALARNRRRPQA
jgi:hypothetical protein